jgi:proteasome lid subunit RPN8/RPN11
MPLTWTARLTRSIVNQLLHHAQQSPDGEVCGLIGSKDGLPSHCYPIDNIATAPQRLFAMDPAQQIAAMRSMREREEELFAIYHSHPAGPSFPSATDLAQANYPETLYLIISMQTRGVLEMQGFLLDGATIIEVPLEIIE